MPGNNFRIQKFISEEMSISVPVFQDNSAYIIIIMPNKDQHYKSLKTKMHESLDLQLWIRTDL
jgi:hypothetical protein